jgi:hypothetical protein
MIVAFVQFQLSEPLSEAAASQLFEISALFDRDLPGHFRKHYILSQDGRVAGGLYFWRDRTVAEQAYDEQWHRWVRELYGAEPQIAWLSNLVTVDNEGIRGAKDAGNPTIGEEPRINRSAVRPLVLGRCACSGGCPPITCISEWALSGI